MVHWGWLVVTAIVSSFVTMLLFCIVAINKNNPFEDNPEYWIEE